MPVVNGQIEFNDGSGGSAPALARTGGAKFDAFTLPPFPKWVSGPDGKSVLVNDAAEEAAATKGPAAK